MFLLYLFFYCYLLFCYIYGHLLKETSRLPGTTYPRELRSVSISDTTYLRPRGMRSVCSFSIVLELSWVLGNTPAEAHAKFLMILWQDVSSDITCPEIIRSRRHAAVDQHRAGSDPMAQVSGRYRSDSGTLQHVCRDVLSLAHWGRTTHRCVGKLTIIGSDNGLSPGRRQAIIWINDGIMLIGSLGTNFSEILIGNQTFSFKKMHLKMSSAKWRPFYLGLNVLSECKCYAR